MKKEYNGIAVELVDWQERHGFSREQAARVLRVSERTMEGWELGRPSAHAGLIRMAMWWYDLLPGTTRRKIADKAING